MSLDKDDISLIRDVVVEAIDTLVTPRFDEVDKRFAEYDKRFNKLLILKIKTETFNINTYVVQLSM